MPKTLLDEARLKFAPDHRTAVFDVTGAVSGNTLTLKGDVQDSVMKGQLLRTHPDHPAEMASQAILGTPVRFLKKERGWSLVQTPDEYLAWTDDRIARMTPEGYATWAGRPKLIVTAEVAWVRASKAKSAQPVSDVVAGAILASLGVEGGWWNGRRGFLPRDEAEALDAWLAGAHDTPDRIIATARRFFGVPYLWGGTSSKGMDCSGFAKTVYYLNGVLLPRDADQQAQVGDPVEIPKGKLNLEPGDLLFFGKHASADSAAKVTHVAISLGGARFIHSSVDVHVNSLDPSDSDFSDFRAISFLGARRIIGAGESSGVRRLATIPYYHANEH